MMNLNNKTKIDHSLKWRIFTWSAFVLPYITIFLFVYLFYTGVNYITSFGPESEGLHAFDRLTKSYYIKILDNKIDEEEQEQKRDIEQLIKYLVNDLSDIAEGNNSYFYRFEPYSMRDYSNLIHLTNFKFVNVSNLYKELERLEENIKLLKSQKEKLQTELQTLINDKEVKL